MRGVRSHTVRAGYWPLCTVGPPIGLQCVDSSRIDLSALVVREALSLAQGWARQGFPGKYHSLKWSFEIKL